MPNPKLIYDLMVECMSTHTEDLASLTIVNGIIGDFAFDREKVLSNRDRIRAQLEELPIEFLEGDKPRSGGWSFLESCADRHGEQWTGEHRFMEALMCLGLATGDIEYCAARHNWSILPGGMPYFRIKKRGAPTEGNYDA